MKKTIWTFGLISGVVSSTLMMATVPFLHKLGEGPGGAVLGYTCIVLSFLLVYFGIRSYRDTVGEGRITFGKAFAIGISITLISCVFYVVTWEIIYFNFMHGLMDSYWAHAADKLKASGASAAVVQAKMEQMNKTKQLYENPFFNAMYTFIEPFPVGLVITLISAGVLRRKERVGRGKAALPAVS